MRLFILFFTLLLDIMIFSTSATHGAGSYNDSIPQIYYFDININAFVSENAEGRERRVLFHNPIIFTETTRIFGPGWAPSGSWFAWGISGTESSHASQLFIASRDSGNVIPLITDPSGEIRELALAWSPKDDFLWVKYLDVVGNYEEASEVVVWIYNPNTNSIVLDLSYPLDNVFSGVRWLGTGDLQIETSTARGKEVLIFDTDGQIQNTSLVASSVGCFGDDIFWSQDGSSAYVSADSGNITIDPIQRSNVVVTNIPTSELFVSWNSLSNYASIFTDCLEGGNSYLYSTENKEMILVSDNAQLISYWGSPEPWFHSGTLAVFGNQAHQVLLIEVEKGILTLTGQPSNGFVSYTEWHPVVERLAVGYFLPDPYPDELLIYDINSDTSTQYEPVKIIKGNDTLRTFDFSPSGEYFVLLDRQLRIFENERFEEIAVLEVISKTFTTFNMLPANISWHQDSNWLLFTADTGREDTVVNITRTDGTFHREITDCNLSSSCFGWLPEVLD